MPVNLLLGPHGHWASPLSLSWDPVASTQHPGLLPPSSPRLHLLSLAALSLLWNVAPPLHPPELFLFLCPSRVVQAIGSGLASSLRYLYPRVIIILSSNGSECLLLSLPPRTALHTTVRARRPETEKQVSLEANNPTTRDTWIFHQRDFSPMPCTTI